jgi:phenylacetate-CoA ligase
MELAELERQAEHLIKAYAGVTTRVRVVGPGTIERSKGKAKRILDLRPKT